MMRPASLQIKSVIEIFGQNGWDCQLIEGRDVIRTAFEAHHTHLQLHAQAFPSINALSIVAETPMMIPSEQHTFALLELTQRANKKLTLGGLEIDLDRKQLMFRITNIFDREKYDPQIVTSMVHIAIAELDRMTPCAITIIQTDEDLLEDLSIERLLLRDDFVPPVPGDEDDDI
jgi:hypothetical protein